MGDILVCTCKCERPTTLNPKQSVEGLAISEAVRKDRAGKFAWVVAQVPCSEAIDRGIFFWPFLQWF